MKTPLKSPAKTATVCLSSILIILSTAVSGETTSGTESAVDQLRAAEAIAAEWAQAPPEVPEDWPAAQDIETASQAFKDWQLAMFEQRNDIRRKQTRLFYERMKVPPPPPTGQSDPEPATTRLDVPLPLPTDTQLSLSVGDPSVSLSVGAEAKALSFIGASYKAGVSYSASDNSWLIGDSADFKAAFDTGPVEVAGTYQFYASRWAGAGPAENAGKGALGAQLSADFYQIKGAVGYNTQKELNVAVGYDFLKTPKALASLAHVSVGIEGELSAPVKVHGLTRGKRTLSKAIRDYSLKAAKLLTGPVNCPHCSAKGQLDCPTCKNTRTVTCTKCKGELHFTCTKCKGSGQVGCSSCKGTGVVPCHMCDGTGQRRCWTCRGSGQVTVYESQTKTRQELVIDQIGFDDAGSAVYDRHYETRTYTTQVPMTRTCSDCGGTGDGGTCTTCEGQGQLVCRRCDGDAKVTCRSCKGTGTIDCKTCRGTGKVKCPDCRGKPIQCPLCKGKKQLGK